VLQGSGFGDVVLVITRYFGGTKLGTGGLVHAYGEAARQAIALAPRAYKIRTHLVMLGLPYRLLEQARLLVAAHGGQILDESFAAEVTQTLRFPVERLPGFQAALSELSNGSLQAELIETATVLVPSATTHSP
jgi:putative IMPACT (imprinted ancient) family translation regulator